MKTEITHSVEGNPSFHSTHRHGVQAVKDSGDGPGLVEVDNKEVNPEEELTESSQSTSNKKTDEAVESEKPAGGYLWRFSSGLVGTTTGAVSGAVGLGLGGIKWVASKGYSAGSAVVDTTKTVASKVPVPTWKKKDKKE